MLLASAAIAGCTSNTRPSRDLPPLPVEAGTLAQPTADSEVAAKDSLVATLAIPPEFSGEPTLLTINFFKSLPPIGMPDAYGDRYQNPAIVAGTDFPITSTQANLQGSYYLTVVVYCKGGGAGRDPVAGVDWVGTATQALLLGPGTGTVEAGRVAVVVSP